MVALLKYDWPDMYLPQSLAATLVLCVLVQVMPSNVPRSQATCISVNNKHACRLHMFVEVRASCSTDNATIKCGMKLTKCSVAINCKQHALCMRVAKRYR